MQCIYRINMNYFFMLNDFISTAYLMKADETQK
uniref:Uncharacterized protein n=1 Tax=Anguilla anguilla TaxID=7936 RepID=A0A0E9TYG2_ANGAN